LIEIEQKQGCLASMDSYLDINGLRNTVQTTRQSMSPLFHYLPAPTNFLDILVFARHKECRGRRDRIYGLLGLLCWDQGGNIPSELVLAPDYTSTVRSVYLSATKMLMRLDGILDILHLKNHVTCDFLPS